MGLYATRAFVSLLAITAPLPCAEWARSFTTSGVPQLNIRTNDASIAVRASGTAAVEARVTANGWRIGPQEVTITDRQTGDLIELEIRIPTRLRILHNASVHVEVAVPRKTNLQVKTGDGSITVDGVDGDLALHSGDGRIEALDLAGRLTAETGDGRIRVRGRFDSLQLHTGDGSMEAEVLPGSAMSSQWRLSTGDGAVRLRVPGDFAAILEATTGDGHIHNDLPVTVSGRLSSNRIRGVLNGGSQLLTVKTGDGSIRLERI